MSDLILHIKDGEITNMTALLKFASEQKDGKYITKWAHHKKRSLDQNEYYWGCCVPLVKEGLRSAGFEQIRTNEHAHLVMGGLFLKRQLINNETGEVISEWVESTTKLSTVQFSEYLESIWQWASDYLGVVIPPPNSQQSMFNLNSAA